MVGIFAISVTPRFHEHAPPSEELQRVSALCIFPVLAGLLRSVVYLVILVAHQRVAHVSNKLRFWTHPPVRIPLSTCSLSLSLSLSLSNPIKGDNNEYENYASFAPQPPLSFSSSPSVFYYTPLMAILVCDDVSPDKL